MITTSSNRHGECGCRKAETAVKGVGSGFSAVKSAVEAAAAAVEGVRFALGSSI